VSIFLSYRRTDSAHALWLYPQLIGWFGRERVFWDRKDIDVGTRFADVIEQQIRNARAFVALVSPNWLFAVDEDGRRRLDSPDDWIRRETVLALREGLLVIPVLVSGMSAPAAEDLPDELRPLGDLQMLPMGDMRFHDLLRERLERVMPAGPGTSGPDQADGVLQRRAASLLRRQVQRLQVRAVELIQDGRVDRAREELNEGSELLMALLDLLPGDPTLDVQLGYLFAKTGQALAATGDEEAEGYTELALSVFERVRANPVVFRDRPGDLASALKGIGEVWDERGDPDAAIGYYREAIALVPDYPYAWHDLFVAELKRAQRGEPVLDALRESFEQTRRLGRDVPGLGEAQIALLERELTRFDPVRARDLLDRARDGDDRAGMAFASETRANAEKAVGRHREAETYAREAIALYEELRDQRAAARVHWMLGGIATALGDRVGATAAYDRARALFEALGDMTTAARVPRADLMGPVADAMAARGREATELEAMVRSADMELAASTRDEDPRSWAEATYKKGWALLQLAAFREDALEGAIQCFDQLLAVIDREEGPEEWALLMRQRGAAYRSLGERQPGATDEAIRCFDRALEVYTRDRHPEEWAGLMMSRGLTLQFPGKEGTADLRAAIRAYDSAMEVYTRETHPDDWERMMFNRGGAYSQLTGSDPIGDAQEAHRSFQAVVDAGGHYRVIAEAALAAARQKLAL
jgi:tetratricopeptide (TPR) repeat protein